MHFIPNKPPALTANSSMIIPKMTVKSLLKHVYLIYHFQKANQTKRHKPNFHNRVKIEKPLWKSRWQDILATKSCAQKLANNRSKLCKTHYTQNSLWIHQLTPFISISNYFRNIRYLFSAQVSAISGKYQIPDLLSSRKPITLFTNPLHSNST